jgi:hypothetical protein
MLLDRLDAADRTLIVPKPAEKVNPPEKAPEHVTGSAGNSYTAGNLNYDDQLRGIERNGSTTILQEWIRQLSPLRTTMA